MSISFHENGQTCSSSTSKDSKQRLPDPQLLKKKLQKKKKHFKSYWTRQYLKYEYLKHNIQKLCKQLASGLSAIFQNSVDSRELPPGRVIANIFPVFKTEAVHLAENYRPVSLTSVCCKLSKHIICKHLLNHLEINNILTNLNHGFRSGFSCETQLWVTLNDLLHFNDKGQQTYIVILDFSNAFDTVSHEEL